MFKTLFTEISRWTKVEENVVALCATYFEPLTVLKNTIIEEENKVSNYLYFIESGFMRLFYYDDNGDEVTTHFGKPNSFMTSFLSFINNAPAVENVECVTDCQLLKIKKQYLKKLIDETESFKAFSLIMFQRALGESAKRANDLATLNAEQRYLKLISEQPEILQNIPIQYIASYLGIKPQSLSRIRKQMIK